MEIDASTKRESDETPRLVSPRLLAPPSSHKGAYQRGEASLEKSTTEQLSWNGFTNAATGEWGGVGVINVL